MTSEEQYGVIDQPDNTCPMINGIIMKLSKALDKMKGYEKLDNTDDLKNVISDVDYWINDIEYDLEQVRNKVALIREWGNEWKDVAKQHEPI